ncbi:MAG: hypothetical protein ACETWQ_02820 [Phycisphaerae bacterium]
MSTSKTNISKKPAEIASAIDKLCEEFKKPIEGLRQYFSVDGSMMSKINVSRFYLAVVSTIFPKVDEVYDWLERNRPNLLGPVQRRLETLRASHNKSNETLLKAWCYPDDQSIDTDGPVKDCITYCVVLQEVLADTAATLRTDLDKKPTGGGGKVDSPNEKSSKTWCWKLCEKTKDVFRRIPYWIYILTLFFAALLTCLYYLGGLEPIKLFIYGLFTNK